MIQKTMLVTDSSLRALTRATTAPRKAATAMPARMTVSRRKLPCPLPSQSAPPRASREPSRADRETVAAAESPTARPPAQMPRVPPSAMAMLAPQAAPAEMPRVKGSASGLRSTPCRATPATASAPPHSRPSSTRARRICPTTSCTLPSAGGHRPATAPSACQTSATATGTGPGRQASGKEAHQRTASSTQQHRRRALRASLAMGLFSGMIRPVMAFRGRALRPGNKKSLFHQWKRPVFPCSLGKTRADTGRGQRPRSTAGIPARPPASGLPVASGT